MSDKEKSVAVKVTQETPWHSFEPGHTRSEGVLMPGDVVHLPAGMAAAWIREGRAVAVED